MGDAIDAAIALVAQGKAPLARVAFQGSGHHMSRALALEGAVVKGLSVAGFLSAHSMLCATALRCEVQRLGAERRWGCPHQPSMRHGTSLGAQCYDLRSTASVVCFVGRISVFGRASFKQSHRLWSGRAAWLGSAGPSEASALGARSQFVGLAAPSC